MSISQLTTIDQAEGQESQRQHRRQRRTNCAHDVVAQIAMMPDTRTLQQAQEVAAGCLARLLVAYVQKYGRGLTQPAMEGGEQ